MKEKHKSNSKTWHETHHNKLFFGYILEGRRSLSVETLNFVAGQAVLIMLWIILIFIGFMFL